MSIIRDTDLGIEMLRDVLDGALEQCTGGKGEARHGHGAKLLDQPWRTLADQHGPGFLTGQAAKKLGEAATMHTRGTFTAEQYDHELLGAIVYTAFALIHDRIQPTPLDTAAPIGFPQPEPEMPDPAIGGCTC